jgi:hypothetical protein
VVTCYFRQNADDELNTITAIIKGFDSAAAESPAGAQSTFTRLLGHWTSTVSIKA